MPICKPRCSVKYRQPRVPVSGFNSFQSFRAISARCSLVASVSEDAITLGCVASAILGKRRGPFFGSKVRSSPYFAKSALMSFQSQPAKQCTSTPSLLRSSSRTLSDGVLSAWAGQRQRPKRPCHFPPRALVIALASNFSPSTREQRGSHHRAHAQLGVELRPSPRGPRKPNRLF